jgi:hypothetical protein
MVAGETDEQVITEFVSGPENFLTQGQNDPLTWLQAAYLDILGRPLDATGQNFFLPQAQAGQSGRAGVAQQLLGSDEYRLHLIDGYFQLYLNRPTNSNDQQFWLSQFKAGQTDEQVIVGIGGSLEGLLNNGGTNAKWVTTLYQKTLGRVPRPDELAFHLNALESDQTGFFDNGYQQQRFFTAQAILKSSEFAQRGTINLAASLNAVISQVYQQALGRSASGGELTFWASQFGGDKVSIVSAILSSAEYFNRAHQFP